MKKFSIYSLFLVLFGFNNVWAANFAVITSPPTMVNIAVLGVAIACIFATLKVLNLIKGGQLFKSWQIFMFAFAALAVGQVVLLLNDFEILALPEFVAPLVIVLTCGLFMFGIMETKKTLG